MVRELRKEKREMEVTHLEEIRSVISEAEECDQRYINTLCHHLTLYAIVDTSYYGLAVCGDNVG